MKKIMIVALTGLLLLAFTSSSYAWGCRRAVVNRVVVKEQVRVKEQVIIKEQVNVAVRERVIFAQVHTPTLLYTERTIAPVYGYSYPPPPVDNSRLDRLERSVADTNQAVKLLAETTQQLILRLSVPK